MNYLQPGKINHRRLYSDSTIFQNEPTITLPSKKEDQFTANLKIIVEKYICGGMGLLKLQENLAKIGIDNEDIRVNLYLILVS
jgi:hypothetical protein